MQTSFRPFSSPLIPPIPAPWRLAATPNHFLTHTPLWPALACNAFQNFETSVTHVSSSNDVPYPRIRSRWPRDGSRILSSEARIPHSYISVSRTVVVIIRTFSWTCIPKWSYISMCSADDWPDPTKHVKYLVNTYMHPYTYFCRWKGSPVNSRLRSLHKSIFSFIIVTTIDRLASTEQILGLLGAVRTIAMVWVKVKNFYLRLCKPHRASACVSPTSHSVLGFRHGLCYTPYRSVCFKTHSALYEYGGSKVNIMLHSFALVKDKDIRILNRSSGGVTRKPRTLGTGKNTS